MPEPPNHELDPFADGAAAQDTSEVSVNSPSSPGYDPHNSPGALHGSGHIPAIWYEYEEVQSRPTHHEQHQHTAIPPPAAAAAAQARSRRHRCEATVPVDLDEDMLFLSLPPLISAGSCEAPHSNSMGDETPIAAPRAMLHDDAQTQGPAVHGGMDTHAASAATAAAAATEATADAAETAAELAGPLQLPHGAHADTDAAAAATGPATEPDVPVRSPVGDNSACTRRKRPLSEGEWGGEADACKRARM